MNKEPVKMNPGDELHLTLLMAPHGLNFVTGKDREHLLAYGRAAFEAGQSSKCLHQIAEPQKFTGDSEMRRAFEIEHGQRWEDPEWHHETGIWASAWHKSAAVAQPAAQGMDAQDAARWREVLQHVGAAPHFGGQHFTLNTLQAPDTSLGFKANLMSGSVAQHFTKAIDAALAAQAKQGGA